MKYPFRAKLLLNGLRGGVAGFLRTYNVGLNLVVPGGVSNSLLWANLARYRDWFPTDVDATRVAASGDIISMKAGVGYTKYCPQPSTTACWIRATWTGPGTVGAVRDSTGSLITFNVISAGIVEFQWTPITGDPDKNEGFSVQWNYTASANPVVGLDIRQISGSGGTVVYPGMFHPVGTQNLQTLNPSGLRFLDWCPVNGSGGQLISKTWAQRTPAGCQFAIMDPKQASAVVGTGTSALTFTASQFPSTGGDLGYSSYIATNLIWPVGAAGNNFSITVNAAAALGGVVVTQSSGNVNIAITPVTGASNAAAIAAQMVGSASITGYVSGNVLTVTAVTGTIGLGYSIYTFGSTIDAKSVITGQLSGTTGGVGTYSLNASSTFGSSGAPVSIACLSLGGALVATSSGGSGAVSPFGPTNLSGGNDPINTTGWAVEDIVAICNMANNADFHCCLPHAVSDDYVTGLATYCRNNLNGKLILEYGNEVWNIAGTYTIGGTYVAVGAYLAGLTTVGSQTRIQTAEGYVLQHKRVMALAAAAYAGARSKLVRICGNVQANGPTGADKYMTPAGPYDLTQYTDQMTSAAYTGNNFFNGSYRAALTQGATYAAFDHGYSASSGKVYYSTTAHTMTQTDPSTDPNMLELTAANIKAPLYSDIETVLSQSLYVKNKAASQTNDLGNIIGYQSYEGDLGWQFGQGASGVGDTYVSAAIKALYTDPLMKEIESHWLYRYIQVLPGSVQFVTNSMNGFYHTGTNFGVQSSEFGPDSANPRRVAFGDMSRGIVYSKPIFQTSPSVTPPSGVIGTTFSGADGTVIDGTFTSRRWLLFDGTTTTAIGTGSTVTPVSAGTLTLEDTATGPGGVTIVTSASVSVLTPPPPQTVRTYGIMTASIITALDGNGNSRGTAGFATSTRDI